MKRLQGRRQWAWGLGVLAVLLVGACGGGGGGGDDFYVTVNGDFTADQAEANLSGSASLPQGSERTGGTVFMPIVTCQLGVHTLTWSNTTNNAQGSAIVLWNCDADAVTWSAFHIPLVMGANRITVTFSDSAGMAQAKVTATRNSPGGLIKG